jgi:hypothetical protein
MFFRGEASSRALVARLVSCLEIRDRVAATARAREDVIRGEAIIHAPRFAADCADQSVGQVDGAVAFVLGVVGALSPRILFRMERAAFAGAWLAAALTRAQNAGWAAS